MGSHTDMTLEEATLLWNNLNRMSEGDFGGCYPIEVIEQACKAAVVLGLMYTTIDEHGEVAYGVTDAGREREPGEDA